MVSTCTYIDDRGNADARNFNVVVEYDLSYCIFFKKQFFSFTIGWPHFLLDEWTTSYNQGQKSLDRLSLFSFIHPFTALTLIFCLFSDGIITPNSCIQMRFPLPTPCFNVALNSGVRTSTIWINIENGEWGKSLVIMPQWSNTFGPHCRCWLDRIRKRSWLSMLMCYNYSPVGATLMTKGTQGHPQIYVKIYFFNNWTL